MSFSSGISSVTLDNIYSKITDADLLYYYLGVTEIPCVICSPLRVDKNPSLSLFTKDGIKIKWWDFATKEGGSVIDLLSRLWKLSFVNTLNRIWKDIPKFNQSNTKINHTHTTCKVSDILSPENRSVLECRVREWRLHDIKYWESYGITLDWLKYAEVYPISHKIITKKNRRMVFGADKHAYAYVERKEGKVTLKIYQPFNTKGFKWSNQHDRSVISLWTKLPEKGDKVCICASLKDALCLWANTGIPSIALQGEGYGMSETAVEELKNRFDKVYILFDNDSVGLEDGIKLAEQTGFINIVLPEFQGGKDISDMYKSLQDKELFKQTILTLFE